MKVTFKFKEDVPEPPRKELAQTLVKAGAKGVRPLFPSETDRELASLFVVDVAKDDIAQKLLDVLQDSELVAFAEPEVSRKLIR